MGLDSYLKANKYVSGYASDSVSEKGHFSSILDNVGLTVGDVARDCPGVEVSVTVGYWRKANAIHGWFVRNVQDGKDDCQTSYVSIEKLKKLRADCLEVLADRKKASDLLPPQSGFFFGSSEVDEYYIRDVEHTVNVIDKCLGDKFGGFDFYYRASW